MKKKQNTQFSLAFVVVVPRPSASFQKLGHGDGHPVVHGGPPRKWQTCGTWCMAPRMPRCLCWRHSAYAE